jgi:hypothetical protein
MHGTAKWALIAVLVGFLRKRKKNLSEKTRDVPESFRIHAHVAPEKVTYASSGKTLSGGKSPP